MEDEDSKRHSRDAGSLSTLSGPGLKLSPHHTRSYTHDSKSADNSLTGIFASIQYKDGEHLKEAPHVDEPGTYVNADPELKLECVDVTTDVNGEPSDGEHLKEPDVIEPDTEIKEEGSDGEDILTDIKTEDEADFDVDFLLTNYSSCVLGDEEDLKLKEELQIKSERGDSDSNILPVVGNTIRVHNPPTCQDPVDSKRLIQPHIPPIRPAFIEIKPLSEPAVFPMSAKPDVVNNTIPVIVTPKKEPCTEEITMSTIPEISYSMFASNLPNGISRTTPKIISLADITTGPQQVTVEPSTTKITAPIVSASRCIPASKTKTVMVPALGFTDSLEVVKPKCSERIPGVNSACPESVVGAKFAGSETQPGTRFPSSDKLPDVILDPKNPNSETYKQDPGPELGCVEVTIGANREPSDGDSANVKLKNCVSARGSPRCHVCGWSFLHVGALTNHLRDHYKKVRQPIMEKQKQLYIQKPAKKQQPRPDTMPVHKRREQVSYICAGPDLELDSVDVPSDTTRDSSNGEHSKVQDVEKPDMEMKKEEGSNGEDIITDMKTKDEGDSDIDFLLPCVLGDGEDLKVKEELKTAIEPSQQDCISKTTSPAVPSQPNCVPKTEPLIVASQPNCVTKTIPPIVATQPHSVTRTTPLIEPSQPHLVSKPMLLAVAPDQYIFTKVQPNILVPSSTPVTRSASMETLNQQNLVSMKIPQVTVSQTNQVSMTTPIIVPSHPDHVSSTKQFIHTVKPSSTKIAPPMVRLSSCIPASKTKPVVLPGLGCNDSVQGVKIGCSESISGVKVGYLESLQGDKFVESEPRLQNAQVAGFETQQIAKLTSSETQQIAQVAGSEKLRGAILDSETYEKGSYISADPELELDCVDVTRDASKEPSDGDSSYMTVVVHVSARKSPQCHVCGWNFFDVRALENHLLEHYKKGEKESKNEEHYRNVKCGKCSLTFLSITALRRHLGDCKACNVQGHKANTKPLLKKRGKIPKEDTKKKLFTCEFCHKSFKNNRWYKLHMLNHSESTNVQCSTCHLSFISKAELRSHLIQNKACICDKQEFKPEPVCKKGEKTPDVVTKFICKFCCKAFRTNICYRLHVSKHSESNDVKCNKCNLSFLTKGALTRHIGVHQGLKHNCDICDLPFIDTGDLSTHRKTHFSVVAKPLTCPDCNQKFLSYFLLSRHKKTHHIQCYPCTSCGKSYRQPYLKLHEKYYCKSSANMKHVCDYCGKEYKSSRTLLIHQKLHNCKVNHHCHICKQSFRSLKSHLRTHFQLEHNRNGEQMSKNEECSENVKCSKCSLTFFSIAALRHHLGELKDCGIQGRKANAKPLLRKRGKILKEVSKFTCEFCHKSFQTKIWYKLHMLNHSESTNVKCSTCHLSFISKAELRSHLIENKACICDEQELEPDIKPSVVTKSVCKFCCKAFQTMISYRLHMSKHSESTDAKCNKCNLSFLTKGLLARHIGVHHGLVCDYCGKEYKSSRTLLIHEKTHYRKVNHHCHICTRSFINLQSHLHTHSQLQNVTKSSNE